MEKNPGFPCDKGCLNLTRLLSAFLCLRLRVLHACLIPLISNVIHPFPRVNGLWIVNVSNVLGLDKHFVHVGHALSLQGYHFHVTKHHAGHTIRSRSPLRQLPLDARPSLVRRSHAIVALT